MPVISVKFKVKKKFFLRKDIKCYVIKFSYLFFRFFIILQNSLGYYTEKVGFSSRLGLKLPFLLPASKKIFFFEEEKYPCG